MKLYKTIEQQKSKVNLNDRVTARLTDRLTYIHTYIPGVDVAREEDEKE